MLVRIRFAAVLLSALSVVRCGPAQGATAETKTSARLESVRNSPPSLRAFLLRMPKGGDLHVHLSGAVYAETFLADAAADNLCVDPVKLVLLPNRGTTKSVPSKPLCAEGTEPAADAFTSQPLYDKLIDSFSLRSFVPSAGWSGHDQFFATFARFSGISHEHYGEWVDEVAARAASQNEQYLELMNTPNFGVAAKLASGERWDGDPARLRDRLLAGGLRDNVTTARAEFDAMDRTRNEREQCGTPQAKNACSVQVRYIYQVLRATGPELAFAQALLGFEVASADPRVVGVNFVQPEDAYLAMSQYGNQMTMLRYLRATYPGVHLSLHAGELSFGMVPPDGLRSHIHDAVEVAGAERIGHGVDVMFEDDAASLLKDMAAKHVLVEVNLTSNDGILGVKGKDHPLHNYLAAGVPFALSTDDEGVSRGDLTHEYMRAVTEQGMTYAQLKQSARASLEHSFLPGEDLWFSADTFSAMRSGCKGDNASAACRAFLKASEKAAQQWELEQRFHTFEAAIAKEAR